MHELLTPVKRESNIGLNSQAKVITMLDIKIINNQAVTSSKAVSDRFDKKHYHVMTAIKNLDCSDKFRATNFRGSQFTNSQNKEYDCYEITRDGFSFLAMGFTGLGGPGRIGG